MLKKKIKYENFFGETVEEVWYFNLTKAEVIEMELGEQGGLSNILKAISETADTPAVMAQFRKFIAKSIGRRSLDGRSFIKNQDIVDSFLSSNAYSELFFELLQEEDAMANFFNAIIPKIDEGDLEKANEVKAKEPDFVTT